MCIKNICKAIHPELMENDECIKQVDLLNEQWKEQYNELNEDKEGLEQQLDTLSIQHETELNALNNEIIGLERKIAEIPPETFVPDKVQEWETKHPYRAVYYARKLPFNKDRNYSEDIRHFINPQDPRIKAWVVNRQVLIHDPWKCNDEIAKLFAEDRLDYKYAYDSSQFGVSEMWLYPAETLELERGDCEDWANLLASRLIAAGVPHQRIRCVAGYTNGSGGGHGTVYVLGDDFDTWYHLNSTRSTTCSKLEQYPTSHDTNDTMGVIGENIWCAWNSVHSWQNFRTDLAEKTFREYKHYKNIIFGGALQ